MSRRVLLLVLVVLVVVGAGVALVATTRPELSDRRAAVDRSWTPLREPLTARYAALDQLSTALDGAGAGDRSYAVDLAGEVTRWTALAGRADAGAEASSANRLEGLATRTRVNVARSARLSRDPAVVEALTAFDAALVADADVRAYNRAVRRYQETRTGTLAQIPAGLLGYGARPVLVVGAPSAR
ncbi:MAG: hypothetical protein ACKOA9_05025 [Actinomycetota bacterium]